MKLASKVIGPLVTAGVALTAVLALGFMLSVPPALAAEGVFTPGLVAEMSGPAPEVTGLSPSEAMLGDLDFTITVIGSGFVLGSRVLWNGQPRDSGFVSSAMLTATVRAADVASPGVAYVSVANPVSQGGQSPTARVFSVLNPLPAVEMLEPAAAWAGGEGFTLEVLGSGFTPTSVIQLAGVDTTTDYVSTQVLVAQVSRDVVAHAGGLSVRVFTPSPGGGLSPPLFLRVADDDRPPVTAVTGFLGLWNRTAVTLSLVATDVGLGVEKTFYRLGRTGRYRTGTTVKIPAPADHSNDGLYVVQFFSIDRVLNWEQPPKELQVGIDTTPPVTSVLSSTVRSGQSLAPKYYIYDKLSVRAKDATLQFVDAKGKVVLRAALGKPSTRAWHVGSGVTVDLPKGSYKMRVLAHDLAGNAQSSTKSGALTVK